jgi:uncharacterized membrane protein
MKNLFLNHPRLWISLILGVAVFCLAPADWSVLTRLLTGWNTGAVLYLILVSIWMFRQTARQVSARFVEEDESAPFILFTVVLAALLSLFAIVQLLATVKGLPTGARVGHITLAGLTLMSSWLLVPTMFTTHYADCFYSVGANERPLKFPDTPEPVFVDFAYFSFTIAAACQTSDVSTTGTDIRRTVLVHTLISFLFNASILGFAINVTAGLLGA